jgi:hypothetical protein
MACTYPYLAFPVDEIDPQLELMSVSSSFTETDIPNSFAGQPCTTEKKERRSKFWISDFIVLHKDFGILLKKVNDARMSQGGIFNLLDDPDLFLLHA